MVDLRRRAGLRRDVSRPQGRHDREYYNDKLFPGEAKERARVRRLAREAEEYVYKEGVSPITDEYFWKGDAPPDEAVVTS